MYITSGGLEHNLRSNINFVPPKSDLSAVPLLTVTNN